MRELENPEGGSNLEEGLVPWVRNIKKQKISSLNAVRNGEAIADADDGSSITMYKKWASDRHVGKNRCTT